MEQASQLSSPEVRQQLQFPNYILLFFAGIFCWFACLSGWYIWRGGDMLTVVPLIAGILALLLFFARRLRQETKYNLLLLLGSTFFTLFLVETLFHWYGNPVDFDKTRFWGALQQGTLFDLRDPVTVAQELRKVENIEAYPFVSPGDFSSNKKVQWVDGFPGGEQIMPVGSISNVTTVYCNESGRYVLYDSDEYGFRNPPNGWQQDGVELMVIGDSFAQGACVADDQQVVAYLRDYYPNTLNVAASGSGPMIELATLKEYVEPMTPKMILWFYFEGNDFLDLQDEKNNPFLMQYLDEPTFRQGLMGRQEVIDRVRRQFVGAIEAEKEASRLNVVARAGKFLTLYELRRSLNLTFDTPLLSSEPEASRVEELVTKSHYDEALSDFAVNLQLMHKIFSEAERLTASWDGELVVIYLPAWERVGVAGNQESDFHRLEMLRIWDELGIEVIDLMPAILTHPDPLSLYPYRLNGHFNEAGYKLVGETILDHLQNRP